MPVFAAHYPDRLTPGNFNEVHLWLLDVKKFAPKFVDQALDAMSADEHERAARFIRGKDEYVASRWLLRQVLGFYTGQAPESLVFERGNKQKPFLPNSPIQFNLSHSGPWAVLAVAYQIPVGVDVEQCSSSRDLLGIAKSYFHPLEYAQLQMEIGADQTSYFYRLWTLKEALLKGLGAGIGAGLESVHFSLKEQIEVVISDDLKAASGLPQWQLHQWRIDDGSFCALAVASKQPVTPFWFDPLTLLAQWER